MSDNAQLVAGAYEAFAKGDIPAVLALIDERCEWFESEHSTYWPGGPLVGPQAVLQGVFMRLAEDYDGFTVHVRRIVDGGDTILVETRYTGTGRATGKALDAQAAHVWDLRDGKVVRWQQYVDTLQLADVTGVTPAIEPSSAAAT
jgi:ketosteroid isomerase-like protein